MSNIFANKEYNTYKTQANAIKKMEKVLDKLSDGFKEVSYIIATNEEGRFFPVVCHLVGRSDHRYLPTMGFFLDNGISVIN